VTRLTLAARCGVPDASLRVPDCSDLAAIALNHLGAVAQA